MKKEPKPMCTLTLPLPVRPFEADVLDKRFELARRCYNAFTGERLKDLRRMEADRGYMEALTQMREYAMKKKIPTRAQAGKLSKEEAEEYKAVCNEIEGTRKAYGFTEFGFTSTVLKYSQHFKENLSSNVVMLSIAKPAWSAFRVYFYGNGEEVHFRRRGDYPSLVSDTKSGIRMLDADGNTTNIPTEAESIAFGPARGNGRILLLKPKRRLGNDYEERMLRHKAKQVRILRAEEHGRRHYYVQYVLEGLPERKRTDDGEFRHHVGMGNVGLYVDESHVTAAFPDNTVRTWCPREELLSYEGEKKILQQKMDASRRAMNPDNYNPDGTVKPKQVVDGRTVPRRWKNSKRYLRLRAEFADLCRKEAVHRELYARGLVLSLLEHGDSFTVNKYEFAREARKKRRTKKSRETEETTQGKRISQSGISGFLTMLEQKLPVFGCPPLVETDVKKLPEWEAHKEDAVYWARYLAG